MEDSQLDKLLERLPYSDGSGRRRFVAGGILLIGVAFFNWRSIPTQVGTADATDLLRSPVIAGGALLLVYAIGSIVEMLGEFFLVRAASGVFWALGFPGRRIARATTPLRKLASGFLSAGVVPSLAVWNLLMGFLGRTNYAIPLESELTPTAREIYGKLPRKVASGLSHPVGDDAEMALKHITNMLVEESDRKWARRLVNRAKDVSAITTSLFILVIIAIVSGVVGPWSSTSEVQVSLLPFQQKEQSIRRQLSGFGRGISRIDTDAARFLQSTLKGLSVDTALEWHANFLARLGEVRYMETRSIKENRSTSSEGTPEEAGDGTEVSTELAVLNEQLDSLRTTADELLVAANDLKIPMLRREALAAIQTVAFTAPFLFLYIGFFTSLRNAVVSILESVAVQATAARPSVGA